MNFFGFCPLCNIRGITGFWYDQHDMQNQFREWVIGYKVDTDPYLEGHEVAAYLGDCENSLLDRERIKRSIQDCMLMPFNNIVEARKSSLSPKEIRCISCSKDGVVGSGFQFMYGDAEKSVFQCNTCYLKRPTPLPRIGHDLLEVLPIKEILTSFRHLNRQKQELETKLVEIDALMRELANAARKHLPNADWKDLLEEEKRTEL